MKDIEKILSNMNVENKKIPQKVHNKIEYALNNLDINEKSNGIKGIIQRINNSCIRKFATIIASITIVLAGGVTAFAIFSGTEAGIPVFEWINSGIKFSSEYEEYKQVANGQKLNHNDTVISLASTIYDDNYVLLEFDVDISQTDKDYLRLGEFMIEDEFIQLKENEKQKDWLIQEKEKGIKNIFYIEFNENVQNDVGGKSNIIIDGKGYWTGKLQTLTKLSDYKYKLYQMYFLTEDMTKGNDEITLTLCNNVMMNQGDTGKNGGLANIAGNYKSFDLDGEINVKVSKTLISENTETIIPEINESRYKNMTQKVEEIKITPLHIIATVSTQIDNVNSKNLNNMLNKEAKVYNEKGNELVSYTYELDKKITYEDKEIEEWEVDNIENAIIKITEIIIIEKEENFNEIQIMPTIEERTWSENEGFKNQLVDLDKINIKFK